MDELEGNLAFCQLSPNIPMHVGTGNFMAYGTNEKADMTSTNSENAEPPQSQSTAGLPLVAVARMLFQYSEMFERTLSEEQHNMEEVLNECNHTKHRTSTLTVKILFRYLEQVNDKGTLVFAQEILKDCHKKQLANESKFETVADAINERVRNAVGERYWNRAQYIHKQLVINKKDMTLKATERLLQRQEHWLPKIIVFEREGGAVDELY